MLFKAGAIAIFPKRLLMCNQRQIAPPGNDFRGTWFEPNKIPMYAYTFTACIDYLLSESAAEEAALLKRDLTKTNPVNDVAVEQAAHQPAHMSHLFRRVGHELPTSFSQRSMTKEPDKGVAVV